MTTKNGQRHDNDNGNGDDNGNGKYRVLRCAQDNDGEQTTAAATATAKTNAGILRYAQDDSGKLVGCDGWCSRRALLEVGEVWG
jgi:hypothetical protein